MPSTSTGISTQKGKKSIAGNQTKKQGATEKQGKAIASLRDDGEQEDDEFTQWEAKVLLKPEDQLNLTEAELKEEITRILKANNPNAPQNIVRYSHKELAYKLAPHVEQLAIHFQIDGNLIHKESEEAKRQIATRQADTSTNVVVEVVAEVAKKDESEDYYDVNKGKNKKPTNQFNFSERASQTNNNPLRDRTTMTEPPPRVNFSANANQWEIFDAYQEDFEQNQKKQEKHKPSTKAQKQSKSKISNQSDQPDDLKKATKSAKILERMVNQNTFDVIAQDFKYYEDDADEFREQEGTLLPLWKFTFEKSKKLSVTSLAWNSKYIDLFAVAYGSYDFLKQSKGLILLYSLKNPSYPEIIYNTESGVMSLDIHPDYPNLIAAGFYDGTVGVFNTAETSELPKYTSNAKNGKHTDPVWQVKWQRDDLDGNMNFFSVSSDGRVVSWTIIKSELLFTEIVTLSIEAPPGDSTDTGVVATLGCGTCFDFNKQQDHVFLVCTEEGKVHKCSKAYINQFLDTVDAHHMAVYSVCWNTFHPKIYLTCSADWTVKIWDHSSRDPLFTYDLGSAVGDAAWAPYSSTVFAAVTADGKVFVFDLNINKYEPICEQSVVQKKKTKLTHIAFNSNYPIIIVGDDRGNVTSLKLSPNLRKRPKTKKGEAPVNPADVEIPKLDKILALVRDPEATK